MGLKILSVLLLVYTHYIMSNVKCITIKVQQSVFP